MLRRIRHQVGMLKYKLLSATLGRHLAAKGATARREIARLLDGVKPAPVSPGGSLEIQMLCGTNAVDMGLLAAWSIIRFLPKAAFCLHSDGSLTEADISKFKKLLPGIRLVSKDEYARIPAAIQDFPYLKELYERNLYGRKLIGAHLLAAGETLLVMDSDVICFHDPQEVRQAAQSSVAAVRYNRDVRDAYGVRRAEVESLLDQRVAEKLNAGFLLTPRLTIDELGQLNAKLEKLVKNARLDLSHFYAEQLSYAIIAGGFADSRPFPPSYDVTSGKTQDGAVIRHYVGNATIRPRFFLDGLALVQKQIASQE